MFVFCSDLYMSRLQPIWEEGSEEPGWNLVKDTIFVKIMKYTTTDRQEKYTVLSIESGFISHDIVGYDAVTN